MISSGARKELSAVKSALLRTVLFSIFTDVIVRGITSVMRNSEAFYDSDTLAPMSFFFFFPCEADPQKVLMVFHSVSVQEKAIMLFCRDYPTLCMRFPLGLPLLTVLTHNYAWRRGATTRGGWSIFARSGRTLVTASAKLY